MRQKLLELLHNYHPTDSTETEFKNEIIKFVCEHENCFDRSLQKGHITGSAWLLNKDGSHALLLHHTKLDKWLQLGGHCDGDPDVLNVALKEAHEESGLTHIEPVSPYIFDIDIHNIPENGQAPAHIHYDIRFLLQSKNNDPVVQNRESKSLLFVSKNIDDLPTDNPSIIRMFTKWTRFN